MLSRILKALGCLLLAAATCAPRASAQPAAPDPGSNPRHVDATQFGERITLGPNWLFAPGDNPAWASPTLDDSGWKTISTQKELLDYGIHDIPYVWYRLHIHLRPGTRNLSVALKYTYGSYEVYANGVRIGQNGNLTGKEFFLQLGLVAWPVPDTLPTPQGDLVLAIRFALEGWSDRGHGTSTPLDYRSHVYLISRDAATRDASYAYAHDAGTYLAFACLGLLTGLVALSLYGALRSRREYLALAVYLFASSADAATSLWAFRLTSTLSNVWLDTLIYGVEYVALIEFVRMVLRQPRARWLVALEVVSFAGPLSFTISSVFGNGYLVWAALGLPQLIVYVVLPLMLVRGWRHGNREARVLLPAVLLNGIALYWGTLGYLAFLAHLAARSYTLPVVHLGTYSFGLDDIGSFVFYVTMLLFLVLRTIAIARERAQAAAELEAARTVQQVLIPEDIPTVPGFALQSVYKPAGQVGGDFFQILPTQSGGVLVVIGDVSGKGMPAAMTVALLVGTFRTLAHYTQSPGEILAAMNRRMMARSHGGFTTCLVLRADPDGTLTIANAGHIAPYLDGKELPLENGLPLGLAAETNYAESTFRLAAGQQLTLVTDGVVEARDKTGALFGFERTASIANQPAEAIASAAQTFGQDDDITALTLERTALA